VSPLIHHGLLKDS